MDVDVDVDVDVDDPTTPDAEPPSPPEPHAIESAPTHTLTMSLVIPLLHPAPEKVPRFARERKMRDAARMGSWIPKRWFVLASLALACGDDDNDDGGATTNPTTTAADDDADDDDGSSTEAAETTTTDGSSTTAQPESSSGVAESESSGPAESSETGPINFCDPVIPGEWNSCHDEQGNVDNTLCNWMGTGGAKGFIGCLTLSETEGANVCFISGCVDACDCFAPPTTGTAEVICGPILEGGENGCGLDCSNDRTCPDGMMCAGSLCFWPPAG